MTRTIFLAAILVTLAACGGLNRAVGVLPNTLDDLSAERERVAGEAPRAP